MGNRSGVACSFRMAAEFHQVRELFGGAISTIFPSRFQVNRLPISFCFLNLIERVLFSWGTDFDYRRTSATFEKFQIIRSVLVLSLQRRFNSSSYSFRKYFLLFSSSWRIFLLAIICCIFSWNYYYWLGYPNQSIWDSTFLLKFLIVLIKPLCP